MPSLRLAVAALVLTLLAAPPARAGSDLIREAVCADLAQRIDFLENFSGSNPPPWRDGVLAFLQRSYADACVRLHQIQTIGTHNSYHVMPRPALFQALLAYDPMFLAWEYTHRPIPEQLGLLGIRQFELDVFADPEGGLYAYRGILNLIGDDPWAEDPALYEPGFKVFHVQGLDFESTCPTLRDCLEDLRDWSAAHPGHLPVAVLIEAKDSPIPDPTGVGYPIPVPIGSAEFRALDAEILSVFPREQLLLPDDVRGDHATLEDAILAHGWPTLGEARGRVLFLLDNGGSKSALYRDGADSLEGRVLFTNANPGDPDAAFVKVNDPIGNAALIPELVAGNYLVRTRADADTLQARFGDTTRRDAALASGAQLVSTDYPEPNPFFGTGYQVQLPDGLPARCNPVNAPAGCRDAVLDRAD